MICVPALNVRDVRLLRALTYRWLNQTTISYIEFLVLYYI